MASRTRTPERHDEVKAYQRQWQRDNRDRVKIRNRDRNLVLKQEVMDAYGGTCTCCGVTELVFLSIDHMDGDGAARRRAGDHAHGKNFYGWLKENGYPAGFQVLCFNCNFAKSNGGCPHGDDGVIA